MLIQRLTTPLHVSYAQYYLWGHEGADTPGADTGGTGVIGVHEEAARLLSGVHTGTIDLTAEVYDAEPELDLDGWDDIAEVTMVMDTTAYVVGWGDGQMHPLDLPPGAGTYRVRVSVHGRDDAHAGYDGAREVHRIAVWPAPTGPTVVWKATDGVGAYWRHADGRYAGAPAVEFRGEVRQYQEYDHDSPPSGLNGRPVALDRTVFTSPDLDVVLTGVDVYPMGCMLLISATAQRDDRSEADWRRLADVVCHGFTMPGRRVRSAPAPAEALRVTFACAGEPDVTSTLRPDDPVDPVVPPRLTGYAKSAMSMGTRTRGDHRAWRWPLPPPGEWLVTLEWAALGVPPTTVAVDGTAILAGGS